MCLYLYFHIFPYTGFTEEHLQEIVERYPEIDTILASVSKIKSDNILVKEARKLGLNFICGNSHSMEIYEDGLPLAYALRRELSEVEVVIFKETMVSIPLDYVSTKTLRDYGEAISKKYLSTDLMNKEPIKDDFISKDIKLLDLKAL